MDVEASLVPGSLALFLKWIDDNERLNVTAMIKCTVKKLVKVNLNNLPWLHFMHSKQADF